MDLQKVELVGLDLNNPDHVGCMYKVRTHPDVDRNLNAAPPKNLLEHTQYLYRVKNKQFFIILADHVCCGYCQCSFSDEEIELGWAIHPDYWGRGVGSYAVQRLIDLMLPYHKDLVLVVKKNNQRAIALYRKHHFSMVGSYQDDIQYKMKYDHST